MLPLLLFMGISPLPLSKAAFSGLRAWGSLPSLSGRVGSSVSLRPSVLPRTLYYGETPAPRNEGGWKTQVVTY